MARAALPACLGRLATQRCLDRVQRGDPLQRFVCHWRLRGSMHIEELAPGVRPARRLGDAALIKSGEPGIAIGLKDAAERRQVPARMLALAVGTVAIQHRGRRRTGEGTVVARVAPQPPGLGLATAGIEHRHRRIVGMHPLGGHHMRRHRVHQRAHQRCRLPDPIRQGRTVEVDAVARINLGLAIQWQVVAVLRHQHVCQHPGSGEATADRQLRSGCLGDALALSARQLRPHMADDAERARHVIQHLGDVFTEWTQCATTLWAGAWRSMRDNIARQVLRQRPAHRLAAFGLASC